MMRFIGVLEHGLFEGNPEPERYRDCSILWRGYCGNPEEVRKKAQSRGLPKGDGSTGDTFALAYRLWGSELTRHVTGEYSIALYDRNTSELFLAHDAFGLQPIFYANRRDSFIVASHLEDIVNKIGIGDIDEEFIADYVANPSFASGRTAYKHIARLEPGISLFYRPDKKIKSVKFVLEVSKERKHEDYNDRFVSLLGDGISAAIPETGQIWCELSGGLDSSSIFALTHRLNTGRLAAFSIIYNKYGEANETRWIESVLKRYPAPRHILDGDEALPYREIPDRICPEPGLYLIDWAGRRIYEKMASEHDVRVVLTGQGGDLVFFGIGPIPYYLADLARSFALARLIREIKRWKTHDSTRRSYLYWFINYVFAPHLSHMRKMPVVPAWHREPSPFIDKGYERTWSLGERGRGKPFVMKTVEDSWFMEQLSVICQQIAHINQIPQSFEFRHPILYRPFVAFMMSLPQELKFTPDTDRALQRRALNGILPEEIRLRRLKTIYDQPTYEGLRQGTDFVSRLTDEPLVAKRGIVDPAKWREAVSQARLGRTHFLPQFEAVASLEIWLRQIESMRDGSVEFSGT